jgi:hypothetical protein
VPSLANVTELCAKELRLAASDRAQMIRVFFINVIVFGDFILN